MKDRSSFDEFYSSTSRRVLHHTYLVCGDAVEAQDLVHEAYARAWQRWSRLAHYDDPEAWVRTVAWRLAANRWRALRRGLAIRSRLGRGDPTDPPSPDRVAIVAALRQLPEHQRRAIVLFYLCGHTVAEIARQEGAAEATVRMRLSRGRAALRPLLHDALPLGVGED